MENTVFATPARCPCWLRRHRSFASIPRRCHGQRQVTL